MAMMKLLEHLYSFEEPMGPKVVRYAYYLGAAVLTVWALMILLGVLRQGFFAFVGALILSPVLLGLGLFFWRVLCEALLALFRIQDALVLMAAHQAGEGEAPAPSAAKPAAASHSTDVGAAAPGDHL